MKPLTERMTKGGAAKAWIKEVEAKDREIERLEQTKDQYLNTIDLLACEKEQLESRKPSYGKVVQDLTILECENAELKRYVTHHQDCGINVGPGWCTCGLNTLLHEVKENE